MPHFGTKTARRGNETARRGVVKYCTGNESAYRDTEIVRRGDEIERIVSPMSEDYLPKLDDDRVKWFANFATKFDTHHTTVGFVAADLVSVRNDSANLKFCIDFAVAYTKEARERVAFKNTIINGAVGLPAQTLPQNPVITPPAVLVLPGIIGRMRAMVNRIKAHPGYTPSIGADLDIVAKDTAEDPNAKPTGSVMARGGSVIEVKFTKGRYDGVQIESQRGTDTNWTPLDKALRSPFFDSRAPVAVGVPELRRYRMRYLKGNAVVGALSDVLTVTTVP